MRASLDVQHFIDALPFSRLQRGILWLCFLVVAVDGFDTAAIGFIAPAIREEWHLTAAALAPLFGAGLFGLMAGALLFGPLADRVGRKTILVLSVTFFGLASLASTAAPDLTWLIVLRFLTGLGLGGAMPNAITLTSEYCPGTRRSSLVTLMFCGFTVGSALGGLASAQILASFGWRGVLFLGGVLPLLLVPLLLRSLPESLRFLVLKRRPQATIDAVVARLSLGQSSHPELTAHEASDQAPIRELFRAPFAFGTVLLWVSFFMSLLIIYLISSWLPTLLHNTGASLSRASWVTATFQIGGTLGAILLGRLMDRFGACRTLAITYVIGAVFVTLCGASAGQLWLLVLAVFGVGFCVSGSQVGANALAAAFYPTSNRATGVSYANAVGRCGSVVGSLSGGWLMSMQLDMGVILSLLAVPALIAAVAIGSLGRVKSRVEAHAAVQTTTASSLAS
ncbi:MFS transporter [Pseudogulbenkiania subflava]|uniref:MFS transporter, AAHS family, 4-hydroxybenzoate transporter n=1 Tax=Pseudogulbenkiania subflava DSM 22618 TaxID=1123014 RepID=A0A1Y6BWR8_9NEIS|nr:aromatic acid/H+ symport family MFS transporter [Pseudogulbenkiania subflava]SMF33096.1 MFS transporter, AAHS family, 4-hydroxybenzoate transporter [Pseudogulbenkiania subflava DSM 22618]